MNDNEQYRPGAMYDYAKGEEFNMPGTHVVTYKGQLIGMGLPTNSGARYGKSLQASDNARAMMIMMNQRDTLFITLCALQNLVAGMVKHQTTELDESSKTIIQLSAKVIELVEGKSHENLH